MKPDFKNDNDLLPVIIQNNKTLKVLMLGYMNKEAYEKTVREKKVTFFSRSKNRLWTKGETSGNYLWVKHISIDCDQDAILIHSDPVGPTCHTGNSSCFADAESSTAFIYKLEEIIDKRSDEKSENSYTHNLLKKGINKIAQKVGEEAVELVIEAKDNDRELFKNEAADLLYHFLILLKAKEVSLRDIDEVLFSRSSELEK